MKGYELDQALLASREFRAPLAVEEKGLQHIYYDLDLVETGLVDPENTLTTAHPQDGQILVLTQLDDGLFALLCSPTGILLLTSIEPGVPSHFLATPTREFLGALLSDMQINLDATRRKGNLQLSGRAAEQLDKAKRLFNLPLVSVDPPSGWVLSPAEDEAPSVDPAEEPSAATDDVIPA